MTGAPSWLALQLLEHDLLSDRIIRAGIRRMIAARLREATPPDEATAAARLRQFAAERSSGPISSESARGRLPFDAPPEFYRLTLGRRLKYSSGYWSEGTKTLDEAEDEMLELSAAHAGFADGQRVLELGCGWGSLALWIARRFPHAEIVAVSNSRTQKAWIDERARHERLTNLQTLAVDLDRFVAPGRFDRIVSVELFEHVRNWRALLQNIARWLADNGQLFLHILTHRQYAYAYDERDRSDWMAAYFFSGSMMPADRLLFEFQGDLVVREHWPLSGVHCQRTAEAWLANMDRRPAEVIKVLEAAYGRRQARRWWTRYRVFFMACAELWGWRNGQEWLVSHYTLTKA